VAAFVASKSADLPQETMEVQVELHRRLENLTARTSQIWHDDHEFEALKIAVCDV
jgi:hypothetical protein